MLKKIKNNRDYFYNKVLLYLQSNINKPKMKKTNLKKKNQLLTIIMIVSLFLINTLQSKGQEPDVKAYSIEAWENNNEEWSIEFDSVTAVNNQLESSYDSIVNLMEQWVSKHDSVINLVDKWVSDYDSILVLKNELDSKYDSVLVQNEQWSDKYDSIVNQNDQNYDSLIAIINDYEYKFQVINDIINNDSSFIQDTVSIYDTTEVQITDTLFFWEQYIGDVQFEQVGYYEKDSAQHVYFKLRNFDTIFHDSIYVNAYQGDSIRLRKEGTFEGLNPNESFYRKYISKYSTDTTDYKFILYEKNQPIDTAIAKWNEEKIFLHFVDSINYVEF